MTSRARQEYRECVAADLVALERTGSLKDRLFDDVQRYQRALRRVEYLQGQRRHGVLTRLAGLQLIRLSRKTGIYIPPHTFGPGLSIAHVGPIIVNRGTRVGKNCRLHVGVNIGTSRGESEAAPTVGDNCYIGPGAKLFGPISIGDNTLIGANAVVTKSFPRGNQVLVGVPATAREISPDAG